jgi:hypothetical protein
MEQTSNTPKRSQKPPAVKGEVIRRRMAGETNSNISDSLGISVNTVKKIINETGIDNANSVESVLARAGITPTTLAEHAANGLLASEVKLASFEGKFTDEREVADHAARFRYFDATAKMLGMYPSESNATIAQLIVRLPQSEIIKGHGDTCLCDECARAWESKSLPLATVLP